LKSESTFPTVIAHEGMRSSEDDGFREELNPSTSRLEPKSKRVKACNIIRYVMLPGMKHRMSTRSGPPSGFM
jgi:hypothetical protein